MPKPVTAKTIALTAIRDLMDDAWSLDDTEVKDLQMVFSAIYQNLKDIERQVREGWPEPVGKQEGQA